MSKSKHNTIDPFIIINKYGIEAVRLYMLGEGLEAHDNSFSETNMIKLYNNIICNKYSKMIISQWDNEDPITFSF